LLKYDPVDRVHTILNLPDALIAELPSALSPNKKLAIDFLHKQVFLGQAQIGGDTTQSGRLTESHVKALNAIGIDEKPGRHFHRGLVTTSTLAGLQPVDVVSIHQHIHCNMLKIKACESSKIAKGVKALVEGIELCMRGSIAATQKSSTLPYALRKEQNFQLSQLGCMLLPQGFLNTLSEPVYFVDTTGKRLGRLIQLLYQG
jgi:hypothetical protein